MSPALRRGLGYGLVAAVALVAGILARSLDGERKAGEASPEIADAGGKAILALSLPDLDGRTQPLSQWRGQVLVVNFWATWCEPCKEEIPEFVKAQAKFKEDGVIFLGIAVDDRESVRVFLKEFGVTYPTLIAPLTVIEASRAAGNPQAALPFTAILDRNGQVVASHLGGLDLAKLETVISPLI